MTVDEAARRHRVFFALWPDRQVARRLAAAAREAQAHVRGRPMREETLHATLAFIGGVSTQRLEVLKAVAARVTGPAFRLQLDRLGCWRHNRILWAGCSRLPPELTDLVSELRQALGDARFPVEERSFAAHVTLLRNADCRVADLHLEPIDWATQEFALVESRLDPSGACYVILERWPLAS